MTRRRERCVSRHHDGWGDRWLPVAFLVLGASILWSGCSDDEASEDDRYLQQLAFRWAPIHTQDVDPGGHNSLDGRSDFITAIDFDDDFDMSNNWEAAEDPDSDLSAHGYYSIVLSKSHAFIIYAFYHPRDWHPLIPFDEHENDLEGALAIIELPGRLGSAGFDYEDLGRLNAVVTVCHNDFFSYVPSPADSSSMPDSFRPFSERPEIGENVDAFLNLRVHPDDGLHHFQTAQDAYGHCLQAQGSGEDQIEIQGGDGVVYFPDSTSAGTPDGVDDDEVDYKLVDIFEKDGLFDQRDNDLTFASNGNFRGTDGGGPDNAASPPWKWDDRDDTVPQGWFAEQPAFLAENYFTDLESFTRTYVLNPYLGCDTLLSTGDCGISP